MNPVNLVAVLLEKRPTETVTGLALALAIYGFLVERGVPQHWAAIVGVVIAFVPTAISEIVDKVRGPQYTPEQYVRQAEEAAARQSGHARP